MPSRSVYPQNISALPPNASAKTPTTVGVFAATQQTVSISTTVGYTATAITGNLKAKIAGNLGDASIQVGSETAVALTSSAFSDAFVTFNATTENTANGSAVLTFNFNDTDESGILETTDTTTVTFAINNTATTGAGTSIYYRVTASYAASSTVVATVGGVEATGTETKTSVYTCENPVAVGTTDDSVTVAVVFAVAEDTTAGFADNSQVTIKIELLNKEFPAG